MNKFFEALLGKKVLWSVLAGVLSTLLVVLLIATQVAVSYKTLLNATLGLKSYELVETNPDITAEDTQYYTADFDTIDELRAYADEVCEDIESEGIVLLKNETVGEKPALPLSQGDSVSLFAMGSYMFNSSAQGLRKASDYTTYPALKTALEGEELNVNGSLWDFYKNNTAKYGGEQKDMPDPGGSGKNLAAIFSIREIPWSNYSPSLKGTFAAYGDAAIVTFSRDGNEGSDVSAYASDGANGNYLALSPEESDLLKELTLLKKGGTFSKIVVLLNSPQSIQLDFLYQTDISVDACLWVGNVGATGIYAVAKVLTGEVVPSGRLTDTYAKDNFSSPAMASWALNPYRLFSKEYENAASYSLHSVQKKYGVYVEGIYVGYRYYETRYADYVEGNGNAGNYIYNDLVAYPFGYGISYTKFEYDNFTVIESEDKKTFDVTLTVRNAGEFPGKEVVQIYVQKPYDPKKNIEKATVELVGFAKTDKIAPGTSVSVSISIEKEELASFDTDGVGTYILDSGYHYFAAGKNAHDALNNILTYRGFGTINGMDYEGDESLVQRWRNSATIVDDKTFAVSSETGYAISGQLDDYDINRYLGKGSNQVTYVSRSDWEGTWPSAAVSLSLTAQMVYDLQSENLIADDGSKVPVYGEDNGKTLMMLRGKTFDDPEWDELLNQMTFEEQNTLLTTGFCQTAEIKSIAKPQTKEMDGPTYAKESNSGARFPCEGIWASSFNMELIKEVGKCLANDSLLTGYNGMWIPGLNMHRTPYGGRAHEYFSEDPFISGIAAEAEIKGIQEKGVIAYPKHYIFNDEEVDRSGVSIWLNEQAAREIYLKPWKYAVSPKRGNAHGVMSSFNRSGCVWASASYALMQTILRDEFGFDGLVITDMADAIGTVYMTVGDGIMAGTEVWLASGKDHSFTKYRNNPAVLNRMRLACHRILYAVVNYSAAMNGISSTTKIVPVMVWWESALLTANIILGVLTVTSVAIFVLMTIISRKKNRAKNN